MKYNIGIKMTPLSRCLSCYCHFLFHIRTIYNCVTVPCTHLVFFSFFFYSTDTAIEIICYFTVQWTLNSIKTGSMKHCHKTKYKVIRKKFFIGCYRILELFSSTHWRSIIIIFFRFIPFSSMCGSWNRMLEEALSFIIKWIKAY